MKGSALFSSLLEIKKKFFFISPILILIFFLSYPLSIIAKFDPHPLNKKEGRVCDVAICCVFKNEADWLKEWIEFHKLIGVTHFYLYNNVSTDHYMEVLKPYLTSGEVELFEFEETPLKTYHQIEIYNHTLSISRGFTQWLAAIDTDEFIVPWETKNLITYLNGIPDYVGGIEIHWQTFGTSWIKSLNPGELLIEKLILRAHCSESINKWVKSIVRPHYAKRWESAHVCTYFPGFKDLQVNPCGKNDAPENELSVKQIRIHHYIWRTEDFFYQVKLPRISKWDFNVFQTKSPHDYVPILNGEIDLTMMYFVPDLKKIVFDDNDS
jgi:glycosyl transferase family 92